MSPARQRLPIPRLTIPAPPQGDSGSVEEVARLLVAAESPLLVADRLARTPNGMKLLIELAETLQAGVIDQGSRMNFPSRHRLNQTQRAAAAVGEADVIVGLEVSDFWATVNTLRDQLHRSTHRIAKPTAKITIRRASVLPCELPDFPACMPRSGNCRGGEPRSSLIVVKA